MLSWIRWHVPSAPVVCIFFNSIGFVCSVRWRNGSIKQLKRKRLKRHHTTGTMNIEHHKVNSSFKQLS